VFQSHQLVKNNISHMNQVISQKNINYLESLKDFLQKEVVPHIENGKNGNN
jgi:hypothetical protein